MQSEYQMIGWQKDSANLRLRMLDTFAFLYTRVVDLGSLEMQRSQSEFLMT